MCFFFIFFAYLSKVKNKPKQFKRQACSAKSIFYGKKKRSQMNCHNAVKHTKYC